MNPSCTASPGKRIPVANRHRRLLRWLALPCSLIIIVLLAGLIWFHAQLRGSLPMLNGELLLADLTAPVTIDRDSLGVPAIRGRNRIDVAFGLGFVHAQDRFFQMDLMRRLAAGQLAALIGEIALPLDQSTRVHRFRARASAILNSLAPRERRLMERYADGVTTGLRSLKTKPFEYFVLRTEPQPWAAADCVLVGYAMYLALQGGDGRSESSLGVMNDTLPAPLFEFLAPVGTEWDAPVQGEAFTAPPVPGPGIFNLRAARRAEIDPELLPAFDVLPTFLPGSNNWAVAGSHTAHGGALLANDMHNPITAPPLWYRNLLAYLVDDNAGAERRVAGVSLPGNPFMIVGSNGKLAWSFTTSGGDWSDLVVLDPVPGNPDAYLTPKGPRLFEHFRESIQVKGGQARALDVRWTLWGPVIDRDHQGRERVLRWVAHDLEAFNVGLLYLELAPSVDEGLAAGNRLGIPNQNLVVADSRGSIGWTLAGPVPLRFGHDGRVPRSWSDGTCGWDGWLQPREYPRIVNPRSGRIWTANNRVLGGEMLRRVGHDYALGARARQIRDNLLHLERATEASMLQVQLDNRALFLERWQRFLLDVLTPKACDQDPRRWALRRHVENWGGRADPGSVGYRAVHRHGSQCQRHKPGQGDQHFLLRFKIGGGVSVERYYLRLDPSEPLSWVLRNRFNFL